MSTLVQDMDTFMKVLDVEEDGKISRNEFMKYYYIVRAQVSFDVSSLLLFPSDPFPYPHPLVPSQLEFDARRSHKRL